MSLSQLIYVCLRMCVSQNGSVMSPKMQLSPTCMKFGTHVYRAVTVSQHKVGHFEYSARFWFDLHVLYFNRQI